MSVKKQARLRRAKRGRMKIQELGVPRLSVYRSAQHIYAQLIVMHSVGVLEKSQKVVTSASTLDKELKDTLSVGSNITAATKVGELIAKRAKEAGISQVAFDRSGYKYHGRVKALAEAARAGGLDF